MVEVAVAEVSKTRGAQYLVRWDDAQEKLEKAGLQVGSEAETFVAQLLGGGSYDLSTALGKKTTVIVFWASWCKPCLLEAPHLIALYEKYASKGVEFVAVSIDEVDDRATLTKVVADLKLPYPVALDPEGKALALYAQGASIPLTFVVGKDGKVSYRHQNFAEGDQVALEAAIQESQAD